MSTAGQFERIIGVIKIVSAIISGLARTIFYVSTTVGLIYITYLQWKTSDSLARIELDKNTKRLELRQIGESVSKSAGDKFPRIKMIHNYDSAQIKDIDAYEFMFIERGGISCRVAIDNFYELDEDRNELHPSNTARKFYRHAEWGVGRLPFVITHGYVKVSINSNSSLPEQARISAFIMGKTSSDPKEFELYSELVGEDTFQFAHLVSGRVLELTRFQPVAEGCRKLMSSNNRGGIEITVSAA